jgi:Protein of unknown function (DUF2637)
MSRADNWITGSAATVVAGVAGTAGWVSYTHALAVVRLAGETGPVAFAYPTFIDGTVYMSSMVLLLAARRKTDAPALAWWSLATGIALTLAANVYSMASHGLLGGVAGALPAVALVMSYELLMWLIRKRSAAPLPDTGPAVPVRAPEPPAELNGHAERARELFAADIAAGRTPGIRKIRGALSVGQDRAQQVRAYLAELAAASPN